MEVKKSPKADLENKKASNLLIGVILTLSVLFIGFEWSEREVKVVTESGITEIVFEEEMIPITEQEPPKQAPPPPEAPKMEEIIEIAENDADIEETTIEASDDIQAAVEVKGYGTAVEVTASGKPAFMDAAMIKDLFAKAAADAGYEYTYDNFDIYPGYDFNPLKQADAVDTGFDVYTLRFTEPRVMGTHEEDVYQIIQVAFPTGQGGALTGALDELIGK